MLFNNIEIKYNHKNNILKNCSKESEKSETPLKKQSVEKKEVGSIYSPDFNKYPRWPYETYENYYPAPNYKNQPTCPNCPGYPNYPN